MKKLTQETGGRVIEVGNKIEKLRQAFDQISQELRSQYNAGYVPTNTNRDGSFRKVEVKPKQGDYQGAGPPAATMPRHATKTRTRLIKRNGAEPVTTRVVFPQAVAVPFQFSRLMNHAGKAKVSATCLQHRFLRIAA